MRNVYLVVVNDTNSPDDKEKVGSAIQKEYKQNYKVAENVYFVASDQLVNDVASRIGLVSHEQILGAVCKLNGTVSGCNRESLWDFLDKYERS